MAKSKVEVEETVAEEEQTVDTESKESEGDMLSTGTSVDEKINQTGADTPTVEKPSAAPAPVVEEKPVSLDELLTAVRYLAGQVSSNAELAELRQAFPRVFK